MKCDGHEGAGAAQADGPPELRDQPGVGPRLGQAGAGDTEAGGLQHLTEGAGLGVMVLPLSYPLFLPLNCCLLPPLSYMSYFRLCWLLAKVQLLPLRQEPVYPGHANGNGEQEQRGCC